MQEKGLELLLSVDKNMSHQQNLEKYGVSLIVFNTRDARYPTLVKFVPLVEELLEIPIHSGLIEINLPKV